MLVRGRHRGQGREHFRRRANCLALANAKENFGCRRIGHSHFIFSDNGSGYEQESEQPRELGIDLCNWHVSAIAHSFAISAVEHVHVRVDVTAHVNRP